MALLDHRLLTDLNTIIRINVTKLSNIIFTLNEECRQKWIETMKEEINETCILLIEEARYFVSVQYLRQNCLKLCKILDIEMLPFDTEALTLYEEKKLLEGRIKEYEDLVLERQSQLQKLNKKQMELCRILEEVPMMFVVTSIPTGTELEKLSLQIRKLEKQKNELENSFQNIKKKVITILREQGWSMPPKIRDIIMQSENSELLVTKQNVQYLTDYHESLLQKINQEEHQVLEELIVSVNNLYDNCHIAVTERKILQNTNNCNLDFIQATIMELTQYRKNNERIFSYIQRYNESWNNIQRYIEEHQQNFSYNNIAEVQLFCKKISHCESLLIEAAMKYEKDNDKPFMTFGSTIPEVIARLHDSLGKYNFNKINMLKNISTIINECRSKQQQHSLKILHIRELDGQKEATPTIKKEVKIGPQAMPSEFNLIEKQNLEENTGNSIFVYPTSTCNLTQANNISTNTGQNDSSQLYNLSTKHNSSDNKRKSKTYNPCRKGKKIPYDCARKKNDLQPCSSTSKSVFKPKSVELIQTLFNDLEL